MPDEKIEKVQKIEEKKQNPEKIDSEVKQVSEFEKEELFDPTDIAALIDKSKEQISSDFWLKEVLVLLDKAKNILGDTNDFVATLTHPPNQ